MFLPTVLLFSPSALAAAPRDAVVVAALEDADADLSADEREEKYAAMGASTYAFFRGSNALYWMDFGDGAWLDTYGGSAETRTWLCGDAHVNNTGAFGDDRGEVVFALNDFDEAVIGDFQLDLLRMATSLVLIARENGGFSSGDEEDAVDAFSEAYLDAMADYATNDDEVSTTFDASDTSGPLDDFLDDVADDDSRADLLDKWTIKVSGKRQLWTSGNPDLGTVSATVLADLSKAMKGYRGSLHGGGTSLSTSYFKVKSAAERLNAGVGSLGVNRYYVLIEGPASRQGDDRILDIKAQGEPSAWAWLDADARTATEDVSEGDAALRVITAAQALGVHVDDLLGTMSLSDGQRYSVGELSPYKETFPTKKLDSDATLISMATQWGTLLATQHARADEDWDDRVFPYSLDEEVDARTDGDHAGFREVMRVAAIDNADQVEDDYASFLDAF